MRYWTQEEISYLKENWGNVSLSYFVKKLNRSIYSIKSKALDLGLKNMIHSGEYITLNQLFLIITGKDKGNCDVYFIDNLPKDFPVSYQKIVTRKVRVVYMDRFWSWFKKNKHKIDLSKTDKGDFGYEPDWVEIKRQADKRAAEYKKNKMDCSRGQLSYKTFKKLQIWLS